MRDGSIMIALVCLLQAQFREMEGGYHLSHAWMMETGEFLDVTIANMDDEDYAWIDIFVYPQFSEGDGSTDAWIKRFDNMIVGIGKVVSLKV